MFDMMQEAIRAASANLDELRAANLTGQILWMQSNRATEFFSRWIELKESVESKA